MLTAFSGKRNASDDGVCLSVRLSISPVGYALKVARQGAVLTRPAYVSAVRRLTRDLNASRILSRTIFFFKENDIVTYYDQKSTDVMHVY